MRERENTRHTHAEPQNHTHENRKADTQATTHVGMHTCPEPNTCAQTCTCRKKHKEPDTTDTHTDARKTRNTHTELNTLTQTNRHMNACTHAAVLLGHRTKTNYPMMPATALVSLGSQLRLQCGPLRPSPVCP